jgi:hypothetical protein
MTQNIKTFGETSSLSNLLRSRVDTRQGHTGTRSYWYKVILVQGHTGTTDGVYGTHKVPLPNDSYANMPAECKVGDPVTD